MAEPEPSESQVDGKRRTAKQEQCEMCEEKQSVGYCSQCEIYICQSCFDRHRKGRKSRNHVLQDEPDSTLDYYETCTEHDHQPIKLYCPKHKFFGCGECIFVGHKQCNSEYISEASRKFEENGELTRMLELIQSLEKSHKECEDTIDEQSKAMSLMKKSAEDDIISFTESLIKYVTGAKKVALEEVDRRGIANRKLIDKLKSDVDVIGSKLDEVTAAFQNEERTNQLFVLAVQSEQKVASLRNTLSTIDRHVITKFTFQPSKLLKDFSTQTRPLGRFTDCNQDEEPDLEISLKKEQERADKLFQQLRSQREETEITVSKYTAQMDEMKLKYETQIAKKSKKIDDLELKLDAMKHEMQTLKGKYNEQLKMKSNEISLLCGHKGNHEMMTRNRTIRCDVCSITYGDQPGGTMESSVQEYTFDVYYHQINMKFSKGTQSKLNVKPDKPYKQLDYKCFLAKDTEGNALLKMINVAFERRLLFTINDNGEIIPGVIELFSEVPYMYDWYQEYVERLKKQLAAVGITE